MKSTNWLLVSGLFATLLIVGTNVSAQQSSSAGSVLADQVASQATAQPDVQPDAQGSARDSFQRSGGSSVQRSEGDRQDRSSRDRSRRDQVAFGSDVMVAAGEIAHSVVAIGGSATVAGEVTDSVVAMGGNTHVTAPVKRDVVTLFGDSYINASVGHDVVTIMGKLELGPLAKIDGQVVNVGGELSQDAAAIINGQRVATKLPFAMHFDWLKEWVKKCLFTGRLLAFDAQVSWAWYVALISLLLYVLTAAMVPQTVARCVDTLETYPGRSLLAALVSIPLAPLCIFLLVLTIVGILLIPFFGLALLTIGWFGKLVMLAWIGKRLLQWLNAPLSWVVAVLLGGVIATLLYTIPVIGLLSYKLLQFIGMGAVLYVIVTMFQRPTTPSVATPNEQTVPLSAEAPVAGEGHSADHAAETLSANSVATPASFWLRMGALLIDVVLIWVVANMLDLDHGWLALLAAYGAVMWKLKGTTVGGIVFHLHLVRADGAPLDWATCIVRALSCFLSLAVMGLGFIWIGIDDRRQGWHDKLAGTLVLRTPESKPLV